MRWIALVVLVAGCDRVWFLDELPEPTDANGDATGDAKPDAPLVGCPNYFTFSATTGTYYFYSEDIEPWAVARDSCRNRTVPGETAFAHLAVITDRTEYTIARGISGTVAWVGIFDPVAGDSVVEYRGVTAEPLPPDLPWDTSLGLPDQPDVQTCARLLFSGGLDDDTCTSPQGSVCECDAHIDNGS